MQPVSQWIRRNWPRHRQKAMYLVVGGWNSCFAYGSFSICYYLLHDSLNPSLILLIGYAIASVNGYLTFRKFVFTPMRHPLVEYFRYQAVYLPILAINLVVLSLALAYTALSAYVIQALLAIFAIIAGYVGSKYFAFRKQSGDQS